MEPAQFFKCLSDETRLYATLLVYQEGELCVCELMQALEDSQPKVSRHLAQLRNCGILDDARRGQWVFYSISTQLPSWAQGVLQAASAGSASTLKRLQKNLKMMGNRPSCI
ncbi:MAG: metalloregulator ArsR/SmtB family transcription factor [Cellvibrionaceae bacterium]|nr:metalloregulator ArsR/SmtB family transcription factor [Cellvibrionaceae bacterium]